MTDRERDMLMAKLEQGREYRNIAPGSIQIRAGGQEGQMIVEGYATTFDDEYTVYRSQGAGAWEIRESIDAHAFDECDMSDVIMQYDHMGKVMARKSNNTLWVKTDQNGLFIRAELSGTKAGRELYEEIQGGYVTRMSFGFLIEKEENTEEHDAKFNRYILHRKITGISKLYDVSAVSIPANDATEISARSFLDGWIKERREEHLNKARRNINLKIRILEGMQC